jgi:3-methylcrotonyl-CoA carboxylase beta subunit
MLDSRLDSGSETFRANDAHNRALADELRAKVAETALAGPSGHANAMSPAVKLLPRDRVTRLLDPGSPFLEIGQLAANGLYENEVPGAGMIAGIGRVSGPRGDDLRQ